MGRIMLVDAHAHIDRYDLLGGDALDHALEEIQQLRILTLSNSMDPPSYERNQEIAKKSDFILPIFGIHPWNAPEYADKLEDLNRFVAHSPLLGEIGLDYHFIEDQSTYPMQRKIFEYFLISAQEQHKIICLHTKGAEEAVLEMLTPYEIPGIIVHWYSGPADIFREFVSMNCYFTFGAELLYSEHIQNLAKQVPRNRLLTETDNPGGPKSFMGHVGLPSLIKKVVEGLAKLMDTGSDEMIQMVQSNLLQLTRRDPRLSVTALRVLEEG
jgi:TatD DNase family protein